MRAPRAVIYQNSERMRRPLPGARASLPALSAQRESRQTFRLNVEATSFFAKRAGARFGGQDARAHDVL
jgi:hypothetical protein